MNAKMTVLVFHQSKFVCQSSGHMSTDLPVQAMGELLAEAINKAWSKGIEPKDTSISVYFD